MTDTTAGAVEVPLWPDDWATEPCGDADERAFLDLHGPRPAIPGDYGASPSRRRRWADYLRDAETVPVGRYL